MDKWIKRYTNTHKWALFNLKKEGNPVICDNIDEPWGHYVKLNKLEKNKYHIISLISGT